MRDAANPRRCEACDITLRPDEKIADRMNGDGFFCSGGDDCPLMKDRGAVDGPRQALTGVKNDAAESVTACLDGSAAGSRAPSAARVSAEKLREHLEAQDAVYGEKVERPYLDAARSLRWPLVRRSRLHRAERQFDGACRELARVEAIRADVEQTLHLIASHPHGGLLANIARVKLERLGAS